MFNAASLTFGNIAPKLDRITIAGNSAGAEDAHYQSLSPLTTELGIDRALVQSAAQMPTDDMKQLDSAIRFEMY